jgi:hypothetical protein
MKKSVSPRSLNTDDNKLSLQPTESKFSLNIDAEGFGEDESGVVKHVRGNAPASFSDEAMVLPAGTNKVIGSISDDQLNVIYFFVHNDQSQHSIVAYNSRTNTYRIVLQSPALEFKEDSFVKADIVRLRRVAEDQPLTYEPPVPPETFTPVEVKFKVSIDLSVWGEMYGYASQTPAPASTYILPIQFIAQGGLRMYSSGEVVTDTSITVPTVTKELKAGDDEYDGWLKNGTVTLFVHPEDLANASCFMQYKVATNLGGPVGEDILRTISYTSLLGGASASSEGLHLGSPCYGYQKNINEMMVSDLPISGIELSIMQSQTSTGRLLDRKLSFKTGCNYSNTDVWESTLLSLINSYDGTPLDSGRSYPSQRMDNGNDPGVGPGGGGGGGGGGDVVVITYCNSLTEAQTVGAAYGSLAEAVAAWQDETAAGNIATITNLCQDLGGGNGVSTNLTPTVIVHDSLSQVVEEVESPTQVLFDVDLQTIPSNYDFVAPFYPSSCGTMRRQTSFIFRLEPDKVESMGSSVPTSLDVYWGSQFSASGYDYGDTMSNIYTTIVEQDFDGGDTFDSTRMRTFEISTKSSFEGPSLYVGTTAIQYPPVIFKPLGGNTNPTITYLCWSNHNPCDYIAGLPSLPDPIKPEINGDDGGGDNSVVITSVTTTTVTIKDEPQEDSTFTSASDEEQIIKAKASKNKK